MSPGGKFRKKCWGLFRPWVKCGRKWKIELENSVLGGTPYRTLMLHLSEMEYWAVLYKGKRSAAPLLTNLQSGHCQELPKNFWGAI